MNLSEEQLIEMKQIYQELAEEYKEKKDYNAAFEFKKEVTYIQSILDKYYPN